MQHIGVAKVLVRNSEGKYLILRGSVWSERPDRSQKPDFPGGMADEGETHAQAAVRELFEEAGISVNESDLQLVYAFSKIKADTNEALIWLLYIVDVDTVPRVKISWEHEAYMWLSKDELLTLAIRAPYQEVIGYLNEVGSLR